MLFKRRGLAAATFISPYGILLQNRDFGSLQILGMSVIITQSIYNDQA